jgi:hypothetical protein
MRVSAPVGVVTRGTTGRRRLRRVDAWLLATHPSVVAAPDALVVDLGFGASPVTTAELARGIHALNPRAQVVGLEIDPARVEAAAAAERPALRFGVGGFELADLRPHLVRALNVLRQYDETEVAAAWESMTSRLAPGGLVVEGTCDELGRLGSWVTLDRTGPVALTLLVDRSRPPSAVAARLPKALIHRNVAGEPVHALLADLDREWERASALASFGARQRFVSAVRGLAGRWPLVDGPARWARGELTVAWSAVAPRGCGRADLP